MIISRTPLRISFVGGGTDMRYFYKNTEGKVLSIAIDKYIYIIVKKRYDKKIVLNYSKREIVDSIDEINHSLIRECLKLVKINSSIEISSIADIPSQGSGLGSSSAFTVGLLNALFTYKGENKTQEELASLACKVEIDICGAPIGKQDQYGTSIGGLKKIIFHQDENVIIKQISDQNKLYKKLEDQLILVNSNIFRSASKVLQKQKSNSFKNTSKLESIVKIVDNFEKSLVSQDFKVVYQHLDNYWNKKKQLVDTKVKKDLEEIYNSYVPNLCFSGKICGAGGGGYFVFFKKPESKILKNKYFDVKIDIAGSIIIYNN
tara:strand:- start:96 stop:1049 length:954 start_codon:yes stop_codon:yes gene_type:complete